MDPITAIGLASAVVNLVDIGARVVKRLRELSEAGDVPEVFRDIRTRLPLLSSVVVHTQQSIEGLSPEARKALADVVQECFSQVTQLDDLLSKVVISKRDSRFTRTFKAVVSLVEEGRVQRIATALKDNVQLLTFLNVAPAEKGKPPAERRPSEPLPSYASATGVFLVPFGRDEHFVGRTSTLQQIASTFETEKQVSIAGIGGVGKSQIAIEYCYRYKSNRPDGHVLWVYGGNIARFYEGYKRIAQLLDIPGWDDPEESILELVASWLRNTRSPYLLVLDNADNIEHWWPGKYKSGGSLDDPANNLSKYLPDVSHNGQLLITTRDKRVASRLVRKVNPIIVQQMSNEEAKLLFTSKIGAKGSDLNCNEIYELLEELDNLPLAVSQAAAFIEENDVSLAEYIHTLRGEGAEEFLDEELDDARRDQDSANSVFRTLNISIDAIKRQKPYAADVLSLLATLDRQSVPKSLLKVPEVTTSLAVLQSFNLITVRAGLQGYQIHRLVQRFVRNLLRKDNTTQEWQEKALASLASEYPTEIGVAQWPICDTFAPHVHIITGYKYQTVEARLNLAHLLCWAADFDIERGLYIQALQRAKQSLEIFQELVPEHDERLSAATWLYGRLRYYFAHSLDDIEEAQQLLQTALRTAEYKSLTFAETAFELAHLFYDQCNEEACLEMGKASFECWRDLEGPNSVRTLDNLHDYALELAMFRHEEEGIAIWQEILERCPASDASDTTKMVFTYRSMAGIAEFQGDAAVAEIFYAKLIRLCEAIYYSEHIHVFDYRLSHTEQIMRQGRLAEAIQLSRIMLPSCENISEWRISASCLQTIAQCYRLQGDVHQEEPPRLQTLKLHEGKLGSNHKETIDAAEALADCYLHNGRYPEARELYQRVISWRNVGLGQTHPEKLRVLECLGICHALQSQYAEAEAAFRDAMGPPETGIGSDDVYRSSAHRHLITVLEQQGKSEKALEMRASLLTVDTPGEEPMKLYALPPLRDDRRFGRMIHPRTWSA